MEELSLVELMELEFDLANRREVLTRAPNFDLQEARDLETQWILVRRRIRALSPLSTL